MWEILAVMGYLGGAGASMACFSREAFRKTPGPFLAGFAWPVIMPVVLSYWLIRRISEKGLKLPSRKPKALQYAEAPLSILAAMVAQRIIAKPNCFNYKDEWVSDKIKVVCNSRLDDFSRITVDDKTFKLNDFKESDKKVIRQALGKAKKLNDERKAAEAAANLNNSALDVIEKLAAVPVLSKPAETLSPVD